MDPPPPLTPASDFFAPAFDYAVDLISLRRVGGGWIFIHPLLMDHFADMWQESAQRGS